ncbi:MAG: nickel-binding protein [Candidatus Dormiibacterota bacterium]
MPQFMDYHPNLKLPQEAIADIARGARAKEADQFGVQQLDLYHNPDGHVYCLLEAPNAQAVRDHHAALGVPCGDIHEVSRIS